MNDNEEIVTRGKRIRYEAVIAIAATIVSSCALGITVYQTYIMKQQQHAAVWPRLYLNHSWFIGVKEPFYRLNIRNVGVGPAIIRKVHIQYRNKSFQDFARLATYIASQHGIPDSLGSMYTDYADLLPDMVIPQQEKIQLLLLNQQPYISYLVEAANKKEISVEVEYESLYGQSWTVIYPTVSEKK